MKHRSLKVTVMAGCIMVASYAGVAAAYDPPRAESTIKSGPANDQAPRNTHGRGESLVLVIGGVYPTEAEAEAVVARSNQSELQGYYLSSTNDFRVTAAYADIRPTSQSIECSAPGLNSAKQALPELGQVTGEQLQALCEERQAAGQGDSLSIVLDTRLERVVLDRDDHGKARLSPPSSCAPQSPCLGRAAAALDEAGALPADHWMAVSAFRTRVGAEQFVTWMRDAQASPPEMVLQAVRDNGTSNIGLGQEAHPDGSGPAAGPLAQQETFQR